MRKLIACFLLLSSAAFADSPEFYGFPLREGQCTPTDAMCFDTDGRQKLAARLERCTLAEDQWIRCQKELVEARGESLPLWANPWFYLAAGVAVGFGAGFIMTR